MKKITGPWNACSAGFCLGKPRQAAAAARVRRSDREIASALLDAGSVRDEKDMRIYPVSRRNGPLRQRFFAFIDRRRRHERWFKRLILLATGLLIALILNVMPWGLYVSSEVTSSARSAALRVVGVPRSRVATDESWKRFRQLGIDTTRPRLEHLYASASRRSSG
jgi:hypothetical protein